MTELPTHVMHALEAGKLPEAPLAMPVQAMSRPPVTSLWRRLFRLPVGHARS